MSEKIFHEIHSKPGREKLMQLLSIIWQYAMLQKTMTDTLHANCFQSDSNPLCRTKKRSDRYVQLKIDMQSYRV